MNIASPTENFAVTSDAAPFDSVSLPAIAANYGAEGAEVHNSLRFALLGDGASPTSASPDGIYLLKLQLSSTQAGLAPSDAYHFVLYKNASTLPFALRIGRRLLFESKGLERWNRGRTRR